LIQKNESIAPVFWAQRYLSENKLVNENKPTLHLFIVWENSRNKFTLIIDDLKKNFIIRDIYEVKWSEEKFLNNLRRFYERRLPETQEKANLCGVGPFLVILVSDPNPQLKKMKAPNDEEDIVNVNIIDNKMKYRKWVGKDFTIHSSISDKETNHDVMLLFGKNTRDLENKIPENWDGSIKKLNSDLIGHNGWNDMRQLFYVLNGTVNYAILRNFDGMPDKFDYNDVDILTEDIKIRYIMDENFSPLGSNISRLNMKIGDEMVSFDFRYLKEQNYMDEMWLRQILARRILHPNGFYVPSKEDYFYSLLYHVIFHKGIISDKYKKKLGDLSKELGLTEITETTFDDFKKSKEFLTKYMSKMKYHNSNSALYKIRHNQFLRIVRVAIFVAKKQGLKFLLGAIKHKIAVTLSDTVEYIEKRGKVIDETDHR